uniref:Uncharacterized protein n=1 Tax=Tanacetum cinerariifolium TaxID=118510 RepID=A0A6L2KDX5_TANCI|nr:hypothetical protein [Tanacetum cinerariifolium]
MVKYVSYPRFISCALDLLVSYEYTQDKQFRSLPNIPSNSNFSKDSSKVTDIELTGHMIVVNNQKDSVSPLLVSRKKKKVKSQTGTPTLPKLQGPEASRARSKKRQKPKSKTTPTETKVTPPPSQRRILSNPTRFPRAPYLISMIQRETYNSLVRDCLPHSMRALVNHNLCLRGNKTPVDMEQINPTIADISGTGAKYQVDETQSTRLRYQFLTENKGKTSSKVESDTQTLQLNTFVDIQAFLLSKDEHAQESDDDVLKAGEDMDEDTQADEEEHLSTKHRQA